jgi:hypothetical protein
VSSLALPFQARIFLLDIKPLALVHRYLMLPRVGSARVVLVLQARSLIMESLE